MDGSDRPAEPCAVLHCERAPVQPVTLAVGAPDAEVCAEHHAAMTDGLWVHDPSRGGIVLAADLDALLLVDRAAMQVGRSYSPALGPFSSLTIDGRSLGSGEPHTVEIVLTEVVVRQLSKLVWMFNRTR
jgi:hypothetical protein